METAMMWTLIGLLGGALFGNMFFLGSRIDSLENRTIAGFDRVDHRFDRLEAKLDEHIKDPDAHRRAG